MTIGISKERLIEIIEDWSPNDRTKVYDKIISQCTELNPWLPIDENTPKDCKVVLAFPMQDGSYEYALDFAFEATTVRDWNVKGMPAIKPTHYQELPGDPE